MSDLVKLVGELTAVRGQRDALMVEIERLRALLREWLEGSEEGADTYEQRVREAVGDVPDR